MKEKGIPLSLPKAYHYAHGMICLGEKKSMKNASGVDVCLGSVAVYRERSGRVHTGYLRRGETGSDYNPFFTLFIAIYLGKPAHVNFYN